MNLCTFCGLRELGVRLMGGCWVTISGCYIVNVRFLSCLPFQTHCTRTGHNSFLRVSVANPSPFWWLLQSFQVFPVLSQESDGHAWGFLISILSHVLYLCFFELSPSSFNNHRCHHYVVVNGLKLLFLKNKNTVQTMCKTAGQSKNTCHVGPISILSSEVLFHKSLSTHFKRTFFKRLHQSADQISRMLLQLQP